MNQPTKDFLKDQLALAADEIIRLRHERDLLSYCISHWKKLPPRQPRQPWWRRWLP